MVRHRPARDVEKAVRHVCRRCVDIGTYPFRAVYRRLRSSRLVAPHHTFVRTRKRDVPKRPYIEPFIQFTIEVFRVLWRSKWLFGRFLLFYFIMAIVMTGIIQTNNLADINTVIDEVGQSGIGEVTEPLTRAFVVVTSSLGGALNADLSEIQQFYLLAVYVFVVLVTIWLLRQRLAGQHVTLRDGLYNAGAPLLAIYTLVAIAVLQLLPMAFAIFAYSLAVSGGFIDGGIEAAMFSVALFLVVLLTLYFVLTTLFACMIATIPGTYPLHAHATAKRIITGQRVRLLVRLAWLAFVVVVVWYALLIPVALIVNAFHLSNTVIIPVAIQFVTGFCVIYATSYCYILYRRMIDEPATSETL